MQSHKYYCTTRLSNLQRRNQFNPIFNKPKSSLILLHRHPLNKNVILLEWLKVFMSSIDHCLQNNNDKKIQSSLSYLWIIAVWWKNNMNKILGYFSNFHMNNFKQALLSTDRMRKILILTAYLPKISFTICSIISIFHLKLFMVQSVLLSS